MGKMAFGICFSCAVLFNPHFYYARHKIGKKRDTRGPLPGLPRDVAAAGERVQTLGDVQRKEHDQRDAQAPSP